MDAKDVLKAHVAKITALTDDQFDHFFSHFKNQRFKKGQAIISEGDAVHYEYFEMVKIPVIAAGGIVKGKGVAAALTLGADGVQMGTAFLATEESNASAKHRELLFSDAARHTTLTRAYTGRLGRGISSRISRELAHHPESFLPFPIQAQFMAPLNKAAGEQEKWDMLYFWSGQIAPALRHRKAGELMRSVIEETTKYVNQ